MLSRATGATVVVKPRTGVRPTTRKVCEALFAILDATIDAWDGLRVLDAFAGAGQLGLEALARGAASVLFIEKNGTVAADLKRRCARRGLVDRAVVLRGDARDVLQHLAGSFDLVFLDPPYSCGLAASALRALAARGVVAPGGVVVTEHHHKDEMPLDAGALRLTQRRRYGETTLTFYRADGDAPIETATEDE